MTVLQRVLLFGGVAAVVAAGLFAVFFVDRSSRLDKAISRLGDQKRFATSAQGGQTVADISTELRAEGSECRDKKDTPARCAALLSAAGFTAVTAVQMLDCTAPDVYDARIALRAYLRKVRDFIDDGATGAPPALPKVITC